MIKSLALIVSYFTTLIDGSLLLFFSAQSDGLNRGFQVHIRVRRLCQNFLSAFVTLIFSAQLAAQTPFNATWETTTDNESITITINPHIIDAPVKFNIDWGDGTEDTNVNRDISHTYARQGSYRVEITGDFPGIQVNQPAGNEDKIKQINSWGDVQWVTMKNAFEDAAFLQVLATDAPDLRQVEDCSGMFQNCNMIDFDPSSWDVRNIQNMNGMFRNASSFNQSLGGWDIRDVTDMGDMLDGAGLSGSNYDITLSGWLSNSKEMNVTLGAQGLVFCNSAPARQALQSNYGWSFTGDSGCDVGLIPFIAIWETTLSFENITIRHDDNFQYSYAVDKDNDGVIDFDGVRDSVVLTFASPGLHEVAIYGIYPKPVLHGSGQIEKLREVVQWGDIEWQDLEGAFDGATHMNVTASDAPNLDSLVSLDNLFRGCDSLDVDINHWDVSSITSMNSLFHGAGKFNSPLDNWNTSNVTDMSNMFRNAFSFNQPIGNWNTSNVTDMFRMFSGARDFNQPINIWNTSNVVNMGGMFSGARDFNQPIGNWDVSKITRMSDMFSSASSFNQPIGNWNTSNVTNMFRMFNFASSFNQPIGNWDVSNVTSMSGMFSGAIAFDQSINSWNISSLRFAGNMFRNANSFNQSLNNWNTSNIEDMSSMFSFTDRFDRDLNNWNTTNVTDMSNMFRGASRFNRSIGDWNTSNVTDMSSMFESAGSFDQYIGTWDISSITNMVEMLSNSAMTISNYDSTLIAWQAQDISNLSLGANGLEYCEAEEARLSLIEDFNWTISGDVKNCGPTSCSSTPFNISVTSGSWMEASSWSQFRIPEDCDQVIIETSHHINQLSNNAQAFTIEVKSGGIFTIEQGETITVGEKQE